MKKYQNIRIFFQKGTFQISQKMFLLLKKLKVLYRGHMSNVI